MKKRKRKVTYYWIKEAAGHTISGIVVFGLMVFTLYFVAQLVIKNSDRKEDTMIELVKESVLSGIICCDIDPSREDAYDEVDRQCQRLYNGTSNGWSAIRESDMEGRSETWDDTKPVPCKSHDGRWHYVVKT